MTVARIGGELTVLSVEERSSAKLARIREGSTLVSMGGRPVKSEAVMWDVLLGSGFDPLPVEVLSRGKRRSLVIEPSLLFSGEGLGDPLQQL
jgi:S1-C subfamily serine protease